MTVDSVEGVADIGADGNDLMVLNVFVQQSLDSKDSTFHTRLDTLSELDAITEDFSQFGSVGQCKDRCNTSEHLADGNGADTGR